MTDTLDQAWRHARILYRLEDTPQMRQAYALGARHALTVFLDDDAEALSALNDQIAEFGKAAITKEASR